jgi:predicted glycogen debranching enzyme
MSISLDNRTEWLEPDGLGGFASGTTSLDRTRRYHALLLAATNPPAGRMVLVNGFDAWVETPVGQYAITSQRYSPNVVYPDGASHVVDFQYEPWPRWTFSFPDGTSLVQELFVPHGISACCLRWQFSGSAHATLTLRPFLCGRDYHATHHENRAFRFEPENQNGWLVWRPYDGVPQICLLTNGTYAHEPEWYRNFLYQQEQERGLDFLEDLASPGTLRWELSQEAVAIFSANRSVGAGSATSAVQILKDLRDSEAKRRKSFPTLLHRSADAYLVRRGEGQTIIAGYPWFTDWGRDTFISIRGLCLALGRLDEARQILLAWAGTVSEGMLPNRFPDAGDEPEFNSVDASLWYIVAVHEFLETATKRGYQVATTDRSALETATLAIVEGYSRGTRFEIHMAADGLLAAGVPGVQLTWMDAKVGDWVVTPRVGKPVEVQALWLNALSIASRIDSRWNDALQLGRTQFERRFWNDSFGCLYDVVDVDHRSGNIDSSIRPNQILAIGGLPLALFDGERARSVVDTVEQLLLTPLGLRTLAPGSPAYATQCVGPPEQRDAAYHQGTVWPWLMGPFVEAWLRVRAGTPAVREEARIRFLPPLETHLNSAGLGHISEVTDAEPPFTPRGCPFQAWSLGEFLRLKYDILDG